MSRTSTFSLVLGLVIAGACSDAPERWRGNTEYTYQLQMESVARGSGNPNPIFDFELSGELAVTPLASESGELSLLLAVKSASFETNQGPEAQARFAKVAADLARPHIFAFAQGRQVRSSLPRDEEATAVAIMRNLAAAFQAPVETAGAGPWLHEEYDATGRYVSEYKPISEANGRRQLSRKKLRYASMTLNERERSKLSAVKTPLPTFTRSSGDATLHGEVLEKTESREAVALELLAGQQLVTETSLRLALRGQTQAAPADREAVARASIVLQASEPYRHASAEFDLDEAKIGGRSLEQLVSQAEAIAREQHESEPVAASRNGQPTPIAEQEAGKALQGRSMRHYLALSALFRKEPSSAARAEAFIRGNSPAASMLLSSLGAAGNEASQRVLRAVWDDARMPETLRRSAAYSLIRAKHPSPESAAFLRDLLQDDTRRDFAELGLGTYVRLFGESGQLEHQKEFGDALVQHLAAATTARQREGALLGLSNSGYVAALPAIERYLADPEPQVRGAAVQALRLMQGAHVNATIVRVAEADGEASVRRSALKALANRSYDKELGRAVAKRLSEDKDAKARLQAVALLEQWAAQDSALLAPLSGAASKDESVTVREEAAAALKRAREASGALKI